MKRVMLQCAVVLGALGLLIGSAHAAEAPKVLNVIAVKVTGDQDVYLQKLQKLQAAMKRLEVPTTMRVWQATLAGPNAGTIYVGLEHESLAAMAAAMAKIDADAEYKKLIKDLNASGIRQILGNSLLVDITP